MDGLIKSPEAIARKWYISPLFWGLFLLALILSLVPENAAAQTITRYTNSSDSATNGINSTSFSCNNGDYFIRDFVVPTSYTVSDVNVGVLMSHTWRSDLRIWLRSPNGDFVNIFNRTGGSADNLNVLMDDSFPSNISVHSDNDTATAGTIVPTYQREFQPANDLNATYSGQSSLGTWQIWICDAAGGDSGTFYQADLYLTAPPTNYADLSLSKSVSNNGGTVDYTLTVSNSGSSPLAASGVTVLDNLPLGTSFNSVVSGTGSYNSGSGIWTVGSVPVGASRSIVIRANVDATPGATIINQAEINSSSAPDIDSTAGNGSTTEDDDASASFTVAGTRVAGIPPSLTTICSVADQRNFLWSSSTWSPAGSLNHSYTVTDLGNIEFDVTAPPTGFRNSTPEITTDNEGGFGAGTQALYFYMNNDSNTDVSSTLLVLPSAVPGLQFRLFDIDFGANQFADKITVTGTYNGGTVYPVLTNGTVNYVSGNVAIGDGPSGAADNFGNVVVTFLTPVDSVTIEYGNHIPTTPSNSGNQAMSLYDFTFCLPTTTLSVTKISSVVSDGISATNPKAVPGATMQYCILVTNTGTGTAENVVASDNIPANMTYVTGSMRSGTSCSSAPNAEDEDAIGTDENNPFGMSFSGTTVTGVAPSLGPSANMAMIFNTILD